MSIVTSIDYGRSEPVGFLPTITVDDPVGAHWLANAIVRLRREVAWLWCERAQSGRADRVGTVLDQTRFVDDRRQFFAEDVTAAYLTDKLNRPAPEIPAGVRRGSFSWVVRELGLQPLECFTLALASLPALDSTADAVVSACLNDTGGRLPTLALVQKLWDDPAQALALADPAHPLTRFGLLVAPHSQTSAWDMPLQLPPVLAAPLYLFGRANPTHAFVEVPQNETAVSEPIQFMAAQLAGAPPRNLRVLPLAGSSGSPFLETAAALGQQMQQRVLQLRTRGAGGPDQWLAPWITRAWLEGAILFISGDLFDDTPLQSLRLPNSDVPVNVFVATTEGSFSARVTGCEVLTTLRLQPSSYEDRLAWWRSELRVSADDRELHDATADCARRFRFEKEAIVRTASSLRGLGRRIRPAELMEACRRDVQVGDLAQPVRPRFGLSELVLPPKQNAQVAELVAAMRNLTRAHYEWGTAKAWAEGGITALFGGPPGTGKTMAAEAVASELNLPLYRIDLSQVVNKYIGETEKNLRRLFDAADASDLILFFDEADSLFGKRTEIKDAHDRYANLEVSYLLERMERFKGLAILATNRKKDLDDAFMRRLRFIVDFPLPGPEERLRLWKACVPPDVDASEIDFPFLAGQFPFAGGHIRGIIFHACLQSACEASPRKLTMDKIVRAVRREFDKTDRAMSLDRFGPYAALLPQEREAT